MATETTKKAPDWWKEMAVYQIWPRSFADGNGDGIGDLHGVLQKLDYIKALGVDAIWFSPLYPSPNADYGYDIADYKNISQDYGTLALFRQVLDEAHKRGLQVIMDLVINHTSDQHEWFQTSIVMPKSKYHDYYFWRPAKKSRLQPQCGRRPNNWLSVFEGKAWEWNEKLQEYYLHVFAKGQPDLNMANPQVREEVKSIMHFWLQMGVDGFREDVITYIAKKEGLPNGFPLPIGTGLEHYTSQPAVKDYLREFKEVLDEYGAFTVGEAPMMTPRLAKEYVTDEAGNLLNMMFHFQHMEADCLLTDWIGTPFRLKKLKTAFSTWQREMRGEAWNALYLENHDHPRIVDRYGSREYRVESAKMLAAAYILQQGTPFIYQGQEIGMTNIALESLDDYKDVVTFNNQKLFAKFGFSKERFLRLAHRRSRENARTPVQWTAGPNAGFCPDDVKPWFSVNPNANEINVAAAEADPDSVLHFYRGLLRFRKENPVVRHGTYREFYKNSRRIYVYERCHEGQKLLVVCSFVAKPVQFNAPLGYDLLRAAQVFGNYEGGPRGNAFALRPYECRVYLQTCAPHNHSLPNVAI
ncbi:MAG: alpha-glucosidase [Oscillospiraceae bacterium]|jgi:oligo-1,6-glucosidase|nr:alpha-glucosidase [Oscillospiraceae bacterium]